MSAGGIDKLNNPYYKCCLCCLYLLIIRNNILKCGSSGVQYRTCNAWTLSVFARAVYS